MSSLLDDLKKEYEKEMNEANNFEKELKGLEPLVKRFNSYAEKINQLGTNIVIHTEQLYDFPFSSHLTVKKGFLYAAEKTVEGQCNDTELEKTVRRSIRFDGSPIPVSVRIFDPTIRTNIILTVRDSSYYLLYRKAFCGNIILQTSREYKELPKSDDNFRVINDGIFKINPNSFSNEDIENVFGYLTFKRKTVAISQNAGKKITGAPCYIATLVYEDVLDKNVEDFRLFRDLYLARFSVGKVFILMYYRFSPMLVGKIGNNIFIKKFIRVVLDFVLHFIRLKMNNRK
ncbi:MAG: hypothetical protein H0Z30_02685 [Candidatus Marinimicrobia bacterium]|nr:hypothetical protein [Candidatus Neomarinimicrobiota bacterium]